MKKEKNTTTELTEDFLMSQLYICETKEDFILAFWFYWVDSVTLNDIDFQKVSASAIANKWFMMQLSKFEAQFRTYIAVYPDTYGRDKDWLYCKCISKLMSIFPKAILEKVKSIESKPPKIRGIKIDFLISIQN